MDFPRSNKLQLLARSDALARDAEYRKYIQKLRTAGYFQGELEGSQLWKQLEEKAADAYVSVRQKE